MNNKSALDLLESTYTAISSPQSHFSDFVTKATTVHQILFDKKKDSPFYNRLGKLIDLSNIFLSYRTVPQNMVGLDEKYRTEITSLVEEVYIYLTRELSEFLDETA